MPNLKATFLNPARYIMLALLPATLAGCVIAPVPPPGPPVAEYGPCCYAYPEYPGYGGYYGEPGFVYAHGYYGEHFRGGGRWRR